MMKMVKYLTNRFIGSVTNRFGDSFPFHLALSVILLLVLILEEPLQCAFDEPRFEKRTSLTTMKTK